MNDSARDIIHEIVTRYGVDVFADTSRSEALLRDVSGGRFKPEIDLLAATLRYQLPSELQSQRDTPVSALLAISTTRMCEDHSIVAERARWAVETWSLALGLVTSDELSAIRLASTDRIAPQVSTKVAGVGEIKQTREKRPSAGYKVVLPHAVPSESLKMVFQHSHDLPPEKPLWYNEEAALLKQYLLGVENRPILLTGFGRFGGSYLAQWAVTQASKELSATKRVHEGMVVTLLETHLREPGDLWERIGRWYAAVLNGPADGALRQRIESIIADFRNFPAMVPIEKSSESKKTNTYFVLPQIVGSSRISPEIQEASKVVYRLNDLESQVMDCLDKIIQCLEEDGHKFASAGFIRAAQLPHRIVILLDRTERFEHIVELDKVIRRSGNRKRITPLRIVAIVDHHDFLRWMKEANQTDADVVYKQFNTIYCAPLWQENIAQRLCNYYFGATKDAGNPLYTGFVEGLNYNCFGSVGEFAQSLRRDWGCNDLRNHAAITLNSDDAMMLKYILQAKLARLIEEECTALMRSGEPVVPYNQLGSQTAARLSLKAIGDFVLSQKSATFTRIELIELGRKAVSGLSPALSDNTINGVCGSFVRSMNRAGILKQARSRANPDYA